jgi:hypothetical protein
MVWEGYEPQVEGEFDLCSACKNDREHTMETHLVLVRNACIARAVMEKARYVVARRLYESA